MRGFREAMCGALRILATPGRAPCRHRPWVILRWIAGRSEAAWRLKEPSLFARGGGESKT